MTWTRDNLAPVEQLLFRSPLVKVGQFRCTVADPSFPRTAPLDNDLFALARRPLWWRRGHGAFRYIEPGGVLLHHAGTDFERGSAPAQEDFSDWFGVRPAVFREVLGRHGLCPYRLGGAMVARPDWRYRLTALVSRIQRGHADPLMVEETTLAGLDTVCRWRARRDAESGSRRPGVAARRHRLVDRTRAYLNEKLMEARSLQDIGTAVGASPFHLCRIFRQETGTTLHAYRLGQRLGLAAERLGQDDAPPLTELAHDLGFADYSHFYRTFRKHVGMTPGALQREAAPA